MAWFDPSSWLSSAWGAMKPTMTDPLGLMALAGTGMGLYGGISAYNTQQNAYNQAINQARKSYANQLAAQQQANRTMAGPQAGVLAAQQQANQLAAQAQANMLATQQQGNQLMAQPPPLTQINSALSNRIIQDALSTAAQQGLTGGGAMTDIVTQNLLRNYIPIYQMAQNQQQAQLGGLYRGANQALAGYQNQINTLSGGANNALNAAQAQANTMLGGAGQAQSGAQGFIGALQGAPSYPFSSSVSALPNYLMQQRLLHQQQAQAAQANHFWDRLLAQPSTPGAAYDWSYDVGSYDPTQGLGSIPNDYVGNITK